MKFRLVGLLALIAMVLASCGGATPEAGGSSEGIQVHGDWTIDIYNEDGSLDRTVEFSNGLSPDHVLGGVLTGNLSLSGLYTIEFGESSNAGVCPAALSGRCRIDPAQSAPGASGASPIVIYGSTTAEADGTIEYVKTVMGTCNDSFPPEDCTSTSSAPFTEKVLDPADVASVSAGQTVDIRVEISFTSG